MMRNTNFFIWLSGVDTDLLEKCPKSERNKYIGFGTLILIPAILGLFSMSYAISTLISIRWIIIAAGIVWFLIILFIDRFIVSSLWRSKETENSFTLAFISRLVLAIFVGIVVAHPLVLLVFNDTIEYQLNEEYSSKEDSIRTVYSERVFVMEQQRESINANYTEQIDKKTERKDCVFQLLTAEQNGISIDLPCGTSSNLPGWARRADTLHNEIQRLENEIRELKITRSTEIFRIDSSLADEKREGLMVVENFIEFRSTDYLARTKALNNMANKPGNSHIHWVKFFLILFFIVIDILPVTLKASTPRGPYEEYYDDSILEARERSKAKRNVISSSLGDLYSDSEKNKLAQEFKMEEIKRSEKNTLKFLTSMNKGWTDFENTINKTAKNIEEEKDINIKKENTHRLGKLRDLFSKSMNRIMDDFFDFFIKR